MKINYIKLGTTADSYPKKCTAATASYTWGELRILSKPAGDIEMVAQKIELRGVMTEWAE